MRPTHLLISARGALVVVLIALFVIIAKGQPSTAVPISTINIGTVEPVTHDTSTEQIIWQGQAGRTIEAKAKPDHRRKDIEKAAATTLKNDLPGKQR